MPELAEVEYYRKQWDSGLRQKIRQVALHGDKRIFRGTSLPLLEEALTGATFQSSETRGKQIALRFSKNAWLGLHLGMTGHLRAEPSSFQPLKHDHLVLFQARQALVFSDARLFGRVRFHQGAEPPDWWASSPPAISSDAWSLEYLRAGLQRRRAPIKAVLLSQELFPGVGNWMADEILWRAHLNPHALAAGLRLPQVRALWQETRDVSRIALETIGVDWDDPPAGWLIHVRWKKTGQCPIHGSTLRRETIGGRTTAWCPRCQRGGISRAASTKSHHPDQ
jgi:formamidopyrimidine-DNA glycosylase